MKKINSIMTALALALIGTTAHASTFVEPMDCTGCDQAPVSAGVTANPFSLALAINAFQNGAMPTIGELAGTWRNVGKATVPGQPDASVRDGYDITGIKNSDGSPQISLQIQKGGNTGNTDFVGNPITAPDSVTLLGLGTISAAQGPNELTFNGGKQEACFAQYSYGTSTGTALKSYSNYECRLVANNAKKMICTNTGIVDPSEAANMVAADKAWSGKVSAYYAFIKN